MQWYRHDQIAIRKAGVAGTPQPAGETRHQVQAVGMLERQNGAAAFVVIGQKCACRVEGRFAGDAGGAEILPSQLNRKGQTATGTARAIEKGNTAPAGGAKPLGADRQAAGHAERRKQKIDQPPRDIFPILSHRR